MTSLERTVDLGRLSSLGVLIYVVHLTGIVKSTKCDLSKRMRSSVMMNQKGQAEAEAFVSLIH